jgi:hypothetical protein
MKFITEDDLRILFKKEPFASYELTNGTRLTPGARQFLADKKIPISGGPEMVKRKEERPPEKKEISQKLSLLKRKTLQAQFLQAGLELLNRDVLLAEQIFDLERKLSELGKEDREAEIPMEPCTGFHKENFNQPYEDCFEITGFHAQSEKGKEILLLHRLRCGVRELAAEWENISLNPVINRLSQMICLEYGGKTCQRKK